MNERDMAASALPNFAPDAELDTTDVGRALFESIARASTKRYETEVRAAFEAAGIDIEALGEVARGNMILSPQSGAAEPPVGLPPANRKMGPTRFR